MKTRHKKFALIIAGVIGLSIAALLGLNAFRSNLVFFHYPSDVYSGKAPSDRTFRLGGMVKKGSINKSSDSLRVEFIVTDFKKELTVRYEGILPDLFGDGQGVITQGKLTSRNLFMADEVLAKHDENYMPPEIADMLEKNVNNGKTADNP